MWILVAMEGKTRHHWIASRSLHRRRSLRRRRSCSRGWPPSGRRCSRCSCGGWGTGQGLEKKPNISLNLRCINFCSNVSPTIEYLLYLYTYPIVIKRFDFLKEWNILTHNKWQIGHILCTSLGPWSLCQVLTPSWFQPDHQVQPTWLVETCLVLTPCIDPKNPNFCIRYDLIKEIPRPHLSPLGLAARSHTSPAGWLNTVLDIVRFSSSTSSRCTWGPIQYHYENPHQVNFE